MIVQIGLHERQEQVLGHVEKNIARFLTIIQFL